MSNSPMRVAQKQPAPAIRGSAGSTPSVEELFRTYSKYVAGTAYRLLGRRDEVDDLVQEVFIIVTRKVQTLENPDVARAWLVSITVRCAHRRLRWRKLRSMVRLSSALEAEVSDREVAPEARTLVSQVYGVLDRLPVKERLAWTLRYIEEESLETVASLCGCSLATAKRRIAAAQAVVRDALEQTGGPTEKERGR